MKFYGSQEILDLEWGCEVGLWRDWDGWGGTFGQESPQLPFKFEALVGWMGGGVAAPTWMRKTMNKVCVWGGGDFRGIVQVGGYRTSCVAACVGGRGWAWIREGFPSASTPPIRWHCLVTETVEKVLHCIGSVLVRLSPGSADAPTELKLSWSDFWPTLKKITQRSPGIQQYKQTLRSASGRVAFFLAPLAIGIRIAALCNYASSFPIKATINPHALFSFTEYSRSEFLKERCIGILACCHPRQGLINLISRPFFSYSPFHVQSVK